MLPDHLGGGAGEAVDRQLEPFMQRGADEPDDGLVVGGGVLPAGSGSSPAGRGPWSAPASDPAASQLPEPVEGTRGQDLVQVVVDRRRHRPREVDRHASAVRHGDQVVLVMLFDELAAGARRPWRRR